MPSQQARYWICTIPSDKWEPHLPDGVQYIKGQKEIGASGYNHWQLVVYFSKPKTLIAVRKHLIKQAHCEPSRSSAAEEYVWKDDTKVEGSEFEFGVKSMKRNNKTDWGHALQKAKEGKFNEIPPDVQIRCYGNLRKIHVVIIKN